MSFLLTTYNDIDILLGTSNAAKQRLTVGPRDAWRGQSMETRNNMEGFYHSKE